MREYESPSSINTFNWCRRKYWYQYIGKVPVPHKSIALIRGTIFHEVRESLSYFVRQVKVKFSTSDEASLQKIIRILAKADFDERWERKRADIESIGLAKVTLETIYHETIMMINNSIQTMFDLTRERKTVKLLQEKKLKDKVVVSRSDIETFAPIYTEVHLQDEELGMRATIDAVEKDLEGIHIIDYKTSKKKDFKEDYKRQLGIYALMWKRKKNEIPATVQLEMAKFKHRHVIPVTDELLTWAKGEISKVKDYTREFQEQEFYEKTPGPHKCIGRTFKCDFWEVCSNAD